MGINSETNRKAIRERIKRQQYEAVAWAPVYRKTDVRALIFKRVAMIGVLGGGWTTTLLAVLDSRIQYSFPVAGTIPFFLQRTVGDFEDHYVALYTITNYLELYIY